jgi:hypothetical protein
MQRYFAGEHMQQLRTHGAEVQVQRVPSKLSVVRNDIASTGGAAASSNSRRTWPFDFCRSPKITTRPNSESEETRVARKRSVLVLSRPLAAKVAICAEPGGRSQRSRTTDPHRVTSPRRGTERSGMSRAAVCAATGTQAAQRINAGTQLVRCMCDPDVAVYCVRCNVMRGVATRAEVMVARGVQATQPQTSRSFTCPLGN